MSDTPAGVKEAVRVYVGRCQHGFDRNLYVCQECEAYAAQMEVARRLLAVLEKLEAKL